MSILHKFNIIIPPQDISFEPGLQENLANGDRHAFAWVYKNYCKKVYDYALLVLGNNEQSEDIVQDVFVKLWMNREKIRGIENFNGYMRVLYRNQVMNVLRGKKRDCSNLKDYVETITKCSYTTDEIINYKEVSKVIHEAVKVLPDCQHLVLTMREQGWKRPQIAKALNKSEFSVRGHINRGLQVFREKLNQHDR